MAYVNVAIAASGAITSLSAGSYAKGQADLQASQMDYQAKQEQQTALETARIIRRAGHKAIGQANAAYAGAGVKVGEGSAGDTERQLYQDVEHDAYQAILEGDRRALGLRTQGTMARAQGDMAKSASYVNAVNSLAGGFYKGMTGSGWRTAGPGFSGQQAPAPVINRDFPRN